MYKHARIAIDIFKLNSIFTLSHRRQTLNFEGEGFGRCGCSAAQGDPSGGSA